MWHLSAPRSAVITRDFGPSAKVFGNGVRLVVQSTGGPIYRQHLRHLRRTLAVATDLSVRRHQSRDPPVCRTGTPGALFRASRDEGPVRNPAPLPVSPEGDHFPRTPRMETYVVSPPPAPAPPRRHACRCIRERNGGTMGAGLREVNLDGGKWLIFGGWGAFFWWGAADALDPEADGRSWTRQGASF
jgi:hypothetical protein